MATVNSAFSASATATAIFNTTHRNGAFSAAATAKASFSAHTVKATGFPNKKLGLKAELLLNGTWTDVTRYVMTRDPVTVVLGRTDESSSMQTGSLTLTLKNTDGRFTPNNASGAYYPYIQLNTRVRLSVSDQSVTGVVYSGYRFWGEVSEWPPTWDVSQRDVSATITASGIWRRLSQSTKTLGSPFTRWNTQMSKTYTCAGYWPMEDGSLSTNFASAVATGDAMTIIPKNGAPTLASCTAFPGSDAIPQLNGAELSGLMHTSASPSQIMFRFCLFVQAGGDTGMGAANTTLARLHLGNNTSLSYVDVTLGPAGGGPFTLNGYDSGNHLKFTSTLSDQIWGTPILVQVGLVQSGSNVIWSLNTIKPSTTTWYGTTTGTATGMSIADASSVIFSPGASWSGISVGQAAVFYANPSINLDASALGGWLGENALTRFNRICAEQGIATESIGTTSTAMGPQIDDTLVNVLQSIEDTDGGFLYETQDQFGLGYRTMASLQDQSPALTLDYPSAQLDPSLAPVNDDSHVRNDVTLANYDGYSVRTYLLNGARSLQDPPNGVGTGYEYTRNVNSTSHAQVNALGSQILDCGCTFQNRYPTITVNFSRVTTAGVFSTAPSMRTGDYLQITSMPSFMGGGAEKQLAVGWTETLSNYTWKIAYNTIPEAPWESSFNPGTSATGQVPGSPVTAAQSGTTSGAQIAEGAVIGLNIAAATVQGDNISAATITATNIAAATITGANIAAATILGSNIVSATITASQIANATITNAQISATAGITGGQIAGGTITGSNITSATITNVQIAGSTITGSNIGPSTITGANIANATVTSVQISNGTITTTQISNSAAITGTQIASATVAGSNIVAGTITGSLIAASTITGGLIAANTITAGNISAATITAAQIASGTITATQIAANTITAGKLVAGIVVAGIVDSTLIQGASVVADGSSGEILVYSSTPAAGDLIGSWSAVAGTDSNTNAYNAGLWLYDSGGNSIGLVPGAGSGATQLAMSAGAGVPTPPAGCAAVYATAVGGVNVVDAGDGAVYAVGRRTQVLSTSTAIANGGGTTLWTQPLSIRDYRVHGCLFLTINSPTQQFSLGVGIPGTAAGQYGALLARAGTLISMTNFGSSSLTGIGGAVLVQSNVYVCMFEGVASVNAAGTMVVTVAASTNAGITVDRSSFVEFEPV